MKYFAYCIGEYFINQNNVCITARKSKHKVAGGTYAK